VPVLIDGDAVAGRLKIRGHFARASAHAKELGGPGARMLAIFVGPHGYVSPSWYEEPRNVPTWNYVAVHASGGVRVLDQTEKRAMVKDLADLHERTAPEPWRLEMLPDARVENLLTAIVGFEIAVDRLEGKLKLSQNLGAEDQRRVREQMAASPDAIARGVAAWMDLLPR
jgi:transcriptional regulator